MEISNIASHQVNFKSQTQTQTSPIEAVKNKFENMEDGEKITVGLTGLGILGMAIMLIKKPHKAKEVVEEIADSKPAKEVSQAISEAIEEKAPKIYPQIEVGHLPKVQKQQQDIEQGTQKAIEAVREYVGGGNYGEIRANATKNLSHDGKKVVKKTLSEVHSEVVAQEIAQEHKLADAAIEAADKAKKAKNVRQGMQNATTPKVAFEKAKKSYWSAFHANIEAKHARDIAQTTGTKRANKRAKVAENKANSAAREFRRTHVQSEAKIGQLQEQAAQKAQNVAEYQSSPHFEDGQVKQMLNADKQAKTRLSNLIKKKTTHGKMSEKQALELIAKDAKETELTRQLAKERLATL